MIILYTSDIHANSNHLQSMIDNAEKENADCIIIGGDIVPHSSLFKKVESPILEQALYFKNIFIPTLKKIVENDGIKIYFDLGNDDYIFNRKILELFDGKLFHLIHMKKLKLSESFDIIGYMNVPPTPFSRKDWEKTDSRANPYIPNNYVLTEGYTSITGKREKKIIDAESDDTIENDLLQLSEQIDKPFIFISHCPPHNTHLDMIEDGLHVGSISIRKFIEEWSEKEKLIASFHGHIHASPIKSGSIFTKFKNSISFNLGQNEDFGENQELRYIIFELTEENSRSKINILKISK